MPRAKKKDSENSDMVATNRRKTATKNGNGQRKTATKNGNGQRKTTTTKDGDGRRKTTTTKDGDGRRKTTTKNGDGRRKTTTKKEIAEYRSKEQTARDDALIADLYCQGHSLMAIVAKLKELPGRSYTLQYADIAVTMTRVRERWRQESVKTYDDYVNRELAKLDKIETEMWDAWEASKKPQTGVSKRVNAAGEESTEQWVRPSGGGNSKFITEIRNCVQQRMMLMKPHFAATEGQTGLTMHEILSLAASVAAPRPALVVDSALVERDDEEA